MPRREMEPLIPSPPIADDLAPTKVYASSRWNQDICILFYLLKKIFVLFPYGWRNIAVYRESTHGCGVDSRPDYSYLIKLLNIMPRRKKFSTLLLRGARRGYQGRGAGSSFGASTFPLGHALKVGVCWRDHSKGAPDYFSLV